MSEAAEKLTPLLATLTADERAEVADYLHELNGTGEEEDLTEEEWEAEWVEECNRRLERMKSGESVGIPHEEVMRQMKEKYG